MYNAALIFSVIIAVLFIVLVFVTSKGDAMSGGGSVRTTFKGKASFDDQIGRVVMGLAGAFVVMMLVMDVLAVKR